jgi:hypothetical protein
VKDIVTKGGNAVNEFVQRHAEKVMAVMSGFDRLWFGGTLRRISSVASLGSYLNYPLGGHTLLKDFKQWSLGITERVKQAGRAAMEAACRPVIYLNRGSASKEDLARRLARDHGIKVGPVCLLEAVEPCWTFEIHRGDGRLSLQAKRGMCLHQYSYFMHPRVGFCHVRVQSWLPLDVRVSMNGREWLCRDLAREGIGHERRDNCLTAIDPLDQERVQGFLDGQLKTNWAELLDALVAQANPELPGVLKLEGRPLDRYWSLVQSEWSTDVLFKEERELRQLYPLLAREAMLGFGSVDVMRFLGAPVTREGTLRRDFTREVVSDLKVRSEGMRLKHRVGANSVKMYDKQGSVLRTETTINDPGAFKVYRGTQADPEDKKWRRCRKGVADLHRVAEVAGASNERYLSSLAKFESGAKLGELLEPLCRRVRHKGRGYRGLRPLEAQDGKLLEAVGRGEWVINGFTNGQLRGVLYGKAAEDRCEERRRGARMSRQLALLRAHGLVKRVSRTRRWLLTDKGREVIALRAAAKDATAKELLKAAA